MITRNKEEVEALVLNGINDLFDVAATPDSALYDLGIDSIDRVELAMTLETKINTFFSDPIIEGWETVGDVIDSCLAKQNGQA